MKGGKDLIAIFAEKAEAMHNASIWKKDAEEAGFKWNYKITTHDIYGSEYPVICTY